VNQIIDNSNIKLDSVVNECE